MLAGLIFATEDADDRAGMLAATLPFGGLTLIEYQARLLIAAGATRIVVAVERMTPELLGALSRIGRRAASVDVVRGAAETVEKLHPLARLLVVADGLVTTGEIVALIADAPGDALLVAGGRDAAAGYERLGAGSAWAGLALLSRARVAEAAAMPRDYDFQSTLLRVAAQTGVAQLALPAGSAGHGVERDSRSLAARGNAILAGYVSAASGWADRHVLAPIARLALPRLMARGVPTLAVSALATLLAAAGVAAIGAGWPGAGIVVVIVATIAFTAAGPLAWLRDEERQQRFGARALAVALALAALATARAASLSAGDRVGLVLAVSLIVAAALAERAAGARPRRRWWASLTAYPLVMAAPMLIGLPGVALALAAIYAAATLAAAIERTRETP